MDHLFYFAFFMCSCVLSSSKLLFLKDKEDWDSGLHRNSLQAPVFSHTLSNSYSQKQPNRASRDITFPQIHFSHSDSPGRPGKAVFFLGEPLCIHSGSQPWRQDVQLMLGVAWEVSGWKGFFSLSMNTCRHKSVSPPTPVLFSFPTRFGNKIIRSNCCQGLVLCSKSITGNPITFIFLGMTLFGPCYLRTLTSSLLSVLNTLLQNASP